LRNDRRFIFADRSTQARVLRTVARRSTSIERLDMKNPWTKKNPFLSMWLSGANAIAGSARGHATAAAKRQASTAAKRGQKQAVDFWTAALTPPKPTTTRRKKRR
jgi:hypothetical protein